MPALKDVKAKIDGVSKTSQITKAMNMVASAKLRGAQDKMESFRPYAGKFVDTMRDLSAGIDEVELPLMEVREVKKVEIVVFTSDRGLCGSFNANIISRAKKLIKQYKQEGKEVSIVTVGNKAKQGLKKIVDIRVSYGDIMGTFQMFNAREISQNVAEYFVGGGSDQVELVYGKFHSIGIQRPEVEELLPIKPIEESEETEKASGDLLYIYEPNPADIMEVLLPLYLNVQVYHAMLEVGASEQAARMTAMDNATRACKDIITDLTRLYNKARQAAVTNELLDIVGGAEALKG